MLGLQVIILILKVARLSFKVILLSSKVNYEVEIPTFSIRRYLIIKTLNLMIMTVKVRII